MGKKEYQVGSVILHENDGYLDIVDGQQRLISISLFLHSLEKLKDYEGANQLLGAEFGEISCYHASENYNEWENLTQLVGTSQAKEICEFYWKIVLFLVSSCQRNVWQKPFNYLILRIIVENL